MNIEENQSLDLQPTTEGQTSQSAIEIYLRIRPLKKPSIFYSILIRHRPERASH